MRRLLIVCALTSLCAAAELKLGAPAPPLTLDLLLQAPAGTRVTWEALRGNVVVLEFWATWCGGCREQIPHLNKLAEQFRNRPVRFISLTDEEPGIVQRFLRDYPISGWIGLDQGEQTFKRYDVVGRPRTVLVDAAGIVRGIGPPSNVSGEVIENLLEGRPIVFSEQAAPTKPQTLPEPFFQIMVRPAGPVEATGFSPGAVSGTRGKKWESWGVSIQRLLADAHSMPEGRIEAPGWASKARYDVALSAPKLTEELRIELLHRCLEGAFQIKVHKEQRQTDVYLLQRRPEEQHKLRAASSPSSRLWGNKGNIKAVSRSVKAIAGIAGDALGKTVFDETGLQGSFDFELKWDLANPMSLIEAVRTQLGLDLIQSRRPLGYLVVDSAVQPQSW